jgi:acyl-CoA thioesterase I
VFNSIRPEKSASIMPLFLASTFKRFLVVVSLLALSTAALASNGVTTRPHNQQSSSATPQQNVKRVLLIGDSLSAGYGLRSGEGWAWQLAAQLKPRGIALVNAAISGETTAGGASRLQKALQTHRPQWVMIQLGANDGLRGLPVVQARANLDKMIIQAKASGAKVLLIGIKLPPNYGADYARAFDEMYASLSQQHKVSLLPFLLAPIATERTMFQADNLHPTAAAQAKLLAHVNTQLLPLLDQTP